MSQGLLIMQELKQLGDKLNSVNDDKFLTYQAGYIYRQKMGSYFYVDKYEDYSQIDGLTGTSFFVIIMQGDSRIEYGGEMPSESKQQIINNFKSKLFQQYLIGKNSHVFIKDIELYPDIFGEFNTDIHS